MFLACSSATPPSRTPLRSAYQGAGNAVHGLVKVEISMQARSQEEEESALSPVTQIERRKTESWCTQTLSTPLKVVPSTQQRPSSCRSFLEDANPNASDITASTIPLTSRVSHMPFPPVAAMPGIKCSTYEVGPVPLLRCWGKDCYSV